jgi:hypothetical protein
MIEALPDTLTLSSLDLTCVAENYEDSWLLLSPFLKAVSRAPSLQGVTHFRLKWHEEWQRLEKLSQCQPSLSPLYSINGLTSLIIDVCRVIDLNDDEIVAMASSWAHLEVLQLFGKYIRLEPAEPPQVHVTYLGVIRLLDSCRRLRQLWMSFTLKGFALDKEGDYPWKGIQSQSLLELHVGPGWVSQFRVEDIDVAAQFIRDVAPELALLKSGMVLEFPSDLDDTVLDPMVAPWPRLAAKVPVRHVLHWDDEVDEDLLT